MHETRSNNEDMFIFWVYICVYRSLSGIEHFFHLAETNETIDVKLNLFHNHKLSCFKEDA